MRRLFVVGTLAGALATLPMTAMAGQDGKFMEGHHLKNYSSKKSYEKFSKEVGLKGEQKEKMRQFLNEQVMKVEAFYKEARQKELEVIEETKTKGSQMLEGEPKAKFEKKMDRAVQKFRKYMDNAGVLGEKK